LRGCFVTGTDTGAGKTFVAAAIAAAAHSAGLQVAAFKPVVTGLAEPEPGHPPDHELLGTAAGVDPAGVAGLTFEPAVSPHLAAQLAGTPIDPTALVAAARAAADGMDVLVVEGVGGLLVPLSSAYTVRDFACDLGLPVVVAARAGLGTINHSLLTLESARAAGLEVRAVVLSPWPEHPGALELSNRETIAALGRVDVAVLARTGSDPAGLARAGAALRWADWVLR
jgi:dethiobiotin synthetase